MNYFIKKLNEYKVEEVSYYDLIDSIHLEFKLDTYSNSNVLYLKKGKKVDIQSIYFDCFYNFLSNFMKDLHYNYPGIDLNYHIIKKTTPSYSIDDPDAYFDNDSKLKPNTIIKMGSIGNFLFGNLDCGVVEFKTDDENLKSFILIRFLINNSYFDFLFECQKSYRSSFIYEFQNCLYKNPISATEKIRIYCNKTETIFSNYFLSNSLNFQIYYSSTKIPENVLVKNAIDFCKERGYKNFNTYLSVLFNKLIE